MASIYETEKRRAVEFKVKQKKRNNEDQSENQNQKQKNNEKSKEIKVGPTRRAIKSANL